MLKLMKRGSVFVDIAIDQGGCSETSHPTSHADPVFTEEGVIHYCVANMPGAYARTASQALTNATFPYLEALADLGFEEATRRNKALALGVTTWNGQLTNREVASAHAIPFVEFPAQ
jgi:alanine dehydrogenase